MYPLCNIHHFAFALVILLDIIRTNGSLNNITDTMGFQWTFVPTPIASCKGQDVIFNWSYRIGKYAVGARTWFKDIGKNVERIAYWNQAQGFIHEAKFKDRVERIGEDGLLLKSVTPKDDNTYTLIVRFPLSSDEDPKQNITLTVYEPPLEGCCRPTLHRLKNGIGRQADLNLQACGTQPIDFKWDSLAGVSTNGSIAIFESNDVSGTIKVCVTGIAVQKCYKGDPTSLCQEEYIEVSAKDDKTFRDVLWLWLVLPTIIIPTTVLVVIYILWRRKQLTCAARGNANNRDDENVPLLEKERRKLENDVKNLAGDLYVEYSTNKELELNDISELQLENIKLNCCDKDSLNPTYEMCLYSESRPRKLLIIEGHSGSGKKTWCKKLLKTWCMSYNQGQKSGNGINQGEQSMEMENINTLGRFPLLFFVSLRDVETDKSPLDIIKEQCLKKQRFLIDLELLISKKNEEIVFLIHGADEAKGGIHILNGFLALNCLTIIICHQWKLIENTIKSKQLGPMAFIHFIKIDPEKVEQYAEMVFSDLHYPKNAYEEFMRLMKDNIKHLMQEAFFVQPLIHIWHQCNTLPSDIAGVCLCFIQENLKKSREKLNSLPDLNLDFKDVGLFIPRAQGMIFIVNFGKALTGLGKTAYHCLENSESRDIFSEEDLMTNTKKTDKRLTEICIAAKLVSSAPVGDSEGQKRLSFCHPMLQNFMAAFYLACENKSEVKDTIIRHEEIQEHLNNLTENSI